MPTPDRSRDSTLRQLAPYLGLGTQLAGAMVMFGALGFWLDTLWNTKPVLLIVGLMLGAIGGTISVIRAAIRANRDSPNAKRKSS